MNLIATDFAVDLRNAKTGQTRRILHEVDGPAVHISEMQDYADNFYAIRDWAVVAVTPLTEAQVQAYVLEDEAVHAAAGRYAV